MESCSARIVYRQRPSCVLAVTHGCRGARSLPNMVAELTTEENLSGIFNWALGGLQKLESIGFDAPQSVLDAIGVYRQDSDRVGNFINEMMEQSTENVSTTVVFGVYKTWCENSGLRPCLKKREICSKTTK